MVPRLPQNPDQFEDQVKAILEEKYGYEVIKPPKNNFGYDLEIIRPGRKSIAVQVKRYKIPVNKSHVKKFINYMRSAIAGSNFSEGFFISASGFTKPARDHRNDEFNKNPNAPVVSLGMVLHNGDIEWDYLDPRGSLHPSQDSSRETSSAVSSPEDDPSKAHKKASRRYYFGIFTNKGGTGKTIVSAHLAGAFALLEYDVILLDIDPQRNLKKLFQNDEDYEDSSLFVPPLRPGQGGNVISVLDEAEWEVDKDNHNDIKIVICDCNPTLKENSSSLVEEFDYCIIPTTLNPLGIAKNSDVARRTFD